MGAKALLEVDTNTWNERSTGKVYFFNENENENEWYYPSFTPTFTATYYSNSDVHYIYVDVDTNVCLSHTFKLIAEDPTKEEFSGGDERNFSDGCYPTSSTRYDVNVQFLGANYV